MKFVPPEIPCGTFLMSLCIFVLMLIKFKKNACNKRQMYFLQVSIGLSIKGPFCIWLT